MEGEAQADVLPATESPQVVDSNIMLFISVNLKYLMDFDWWSKMS